MRTLLVPKRPLVRVGPLEPAVINFDTTTTNNVVSPILVNGVQTPVVNSTTTNRLNAIRPYVGYAGIQATRNIYTSNYNGLQTQLQKKFKGSLDVQCRVYLVSRPDFLCS